MEFSYCINVIVRPKYLKVQEVIRAQVLDLTPQTWYVGSKQKKLGPEPLWVNGIIFILVFLVS